jgi:hypothetical protein
LRLSSLPDRRVKPASVWIEAERTFPLIPRDTLRFTALFRRRAAVEREFGRLKHDWALAPLRVPRPGSGSATCRSDDPRQTRVHVA